MVTICGKRGRLSQQYGRLLLQGFHSAGFKFRIQTKNLILADGFAFLSLFNSKLTAARINIITAAATYRSGNIA